MPNPLDPKEVVATSKRVSKPNPDPTAPKVGGVLGIGAGAQQGKQYVVTLRDGTEITYWEPNEGNGSPVEVGRDTDPEQAKQFLKDQEEARKTAATATTAGQKDATTAETERANRAREAETAKRNAQTAANQAGQAARADRTAGRQITAADAAAKLAAIQEERRSNIAERGMSVTEANARARAHYDELDNDLKQAENQRAIQAAKLAEDKARFEREKFQTEQVSAREKETTRQREAGATFAYNAGQDAVGNAMKLLPYQVGPTFGREFSAALSGFGRGDGSMSFSPSALVYDAPNYDQIAEQAAQRAHALYSAPVAQPGMAPAAVPQALATLPVAAPYVAPPMAMPPSVGPNTQPPGLPIPGVR